MNAPPQHKTGPHTQVPRDPQREPHTPAQTPHPTDLSHANFARHDHGSELRGYDNGSASLL